jgi:adenylylsulfate kinase-like enzyme
MAFVAAEIVRHGGIVIIVAVGPDESPRNEARTLVGPDATVLVYVATRLAACGERDVKGLCARAQRGEFVGLTRVGDPYEPPLGADLVLDTAERTAESCVDDIWHVLATRGVQCVTHANSDSGVNARPRPRAQQTHGKAPRL